MLLEVLIVDDNEDITILLQDIVNMENHQVTVAATGERAKAAIDEKQFDLAFCDLTLPDISGWEVVDYLKTRSPGTPVAIISGLGDAGADDSAHSNSIDVVLKKPFKINEIQSVLARYATP